MLNLAGKEAGAVGKVTLKDVAEKAGVSISTVSRVANKNYANVSNELIDRVEQAIRETGYQMPEKEKINPDRKLIKLGVLLTEVNNESMNCLLAGIFSVTDNYDVVTIVNDYKLNIAKETKSLEMFMSESVDGIIATNVEQGTLPPCYQTIIDKKIPLVIVSNTRMSTDGQKGVSLVCDDSYKAMRSGVRYLLSLGHDKILLLGFPGKNGRYRYHALAVEQEFKSRGLRLGKDSRVDCENSYMSAYIEIDKICKQRRFEHTAIFTASDVIAFGAIDALRANGIAPFDDISILGYDNIDAARYVGLTTISEPMFELGVNAAYIVMNLINGTQSEDKITILNNSLEIRTSCRQRKLRK